MKKTKVCNSIIKALIPAAPVTIAARVIALEDEAKREIGSQFVSEDQLIDLVMGIWKAGNG